MDEASLHFLCMASSCAESNLLRSGGDIEMLCNDIFVNSVDGKLWIVKGRRVYVVSDPEILEEVSEIVMDEGFELFCEWWTERSRINFEVDEDGIVFDKGGHRWRANWKDLERFEVRVVLERIEGNESIVLNDWIKPDRIWIIKNNTKVLEEVLEVNKDEVRREELYTDGEAVFIGIRMVHNVFGVDSVARLYEIRDFDWIVVKKRDDVMIFARGQEEEVEISHNPSSYEDSKKIAR